MSLLHLLMAAGLQRVSGLSNNTLEVLLASTGYLWWPDEFGNIRDPYLEEKDDICAVRSVTYPNLLRYLFLVRPRVALRRRQVNPASSTPLYGCSVISTNLLAGDLILEQLPSVLWSSVVDSDRARVLLWT